VRFAFIKAEKARHGVSLLCDVLEVSRQGFYAWLRRPPSRRQQRDVVLTKQIFRLFTDSGQTYGSPRMYKALSGEGEVTSRKRVQRLMRCAGLVGRPPRRRFVRTTDSRHGFSVAPNLLDRQFQPEAQDRVWATDITYVPTGKGWLYLAVVLDLFSRKVVGWSMQPYLDRRLVIDALGMALAARRPDPGLLHHSDRGVQYACDEYQRMLKDDEMVISMSRKGNCWDNAVVESFFSTLKLELIYRRRFTDHDAARAAIFRYIESWYNRRRLHSTLGYVCPVEYERRKSSVN
jgi:transposase InsO family protein